MTTAVSNLFEIDSLRAFFRARRVRELDEGQVLNMLSEVLEKSEEFKNLKPKVGVQPKLECRGRPIHEMYPEARATRR